MAELKRTAHLLGPWQGYDPQETRENTIPWMENILPGRTLRTRKKRGLRGTWENLKGVLSDEFIFTIRGNTLYMDETAVEGLSFAAARQRQMVRLGDYLLIYPDKVAVNIYDPADNFRLQQSFTGSVKRTLRTAYGAVTAANALPDTGSEGAQVLVEDTLYVRRAGSWRVSDREVFTQLACAGIGENFREEDGVTLGETAHQVVSADADTLLLRGPILTPGEMELTVTRPAPQLDWLQVWGDRVFGCRHAAGSGSMLWACAPDNIRNWVWDDAWSAKAWASGPFTGCGALHGSPIFFTENCILRIYPDSGGDHRVDTLAAPGVAPGSGKSVAAWEGTLYYLSSQGVMAYDGSYPRRVSRDLGTEVWKNGVAACWAGEYWLAADNSWDIPHLVCCDVEEETWRREDGLQVTHLFTHAGALQLVDSLGNVWCAQGLVGQTEEDFYYTCQLPRFDLYSLRRPKLVGLELRLQVRGQLDIYLEYDSSGDPIHLTTLQDLGISTVSIPIPPRLADHFRISFDGQGELCIHTMAYILEQRGV